MLSPLTRLASAPARDRRRAEAVLRASHEVGDADAAVLELVGGADHQAVLADLQLRQVDRERELSLVRLRERLPVELDQDRLGVGAGDRDEYRERLGRAGSAVRSPLGVDVRTLPALPTTQEAECRVALRSALVLAEDLDLMTPGSQPLLGDLDREIGLLRGRYLLPVEEDHRTLQMRRVDADVELEPLRDATLVLRKAVYRGRR